MVGTISLTCAVHSQGQDKNTADIANDPFSTMPTDTFS